MSDDVLDFIALQSVNRRGLEMSVVRELTPEDAGAEKTPEAQRREPIQRLAQRHHNQAMLIAEGRSQIEVCAKLGCSQTTLSRLMHDPMFQELVEFYRVQKEQVYLDAHAKLAMLGTTAAEELLARLEDDPDKFSNMDLKKIMEAAMDRSIAPSKAGAGGAVAGQNTAVTITFSGMGAKALPNPAPLTITQEDGQ